MAHAGARPRRSRGLLRCTGNRRGRCAVAPRDRRQYLDIRAAEPFDWDYWPDAEETKAIDARWAEANSFVESALDERVRSETAARLRELVRDSRPVEDSWSAEMRWHRAFWTLAYGEQAGHTMVPIALPPERLRLVVDVITRRIPSDSFDSLEQLARERLSVPDLELLDRLTEFGAEERADPFVGLAVDLGHANTRDVWRLLRSVVADNELDEFVRWANEQLNLSRFSPPRSFGPPSW